MKKFPKHKIQWQKREELWDLADFSADIIKRYIEWNLAYCTACPCSLAGADLCQQCRTAAHLFIGVTDVN